MTLAQCLALLVRPSVADVQLGNPVYVRGATGCVAAAQAGVVVSEADPWPLVWDTVVAAKVGEWRGPAYCVDGERALGWLVSGRDVIRVDAEAALARAAAGPVDLAVVVVDKCRDRRGDAQVVAQGAARTFPCGDRTCELWRVGDVRLSLDGVRQWALDLAAL